MICRLCLCTLCEEDAVYLYEPDKVSTEAKLAKIIVKHFYLEISPDDSISTCICLQCYEQLDTFHRFWIFIEQKQSTLRNEFLEVKCDVEITKTQSTELVDTKIDGGDSNGGNSDGHEEVLLDLKHVAQTDLQEMDEQPLRESDFASSMEIESTNRIDLLATDFVKCNSSSDDDVPLLSLKTKQRDLKSRTKRKISKQKSVRKKSSRQESTTLARHTSSTPAAILEPDSKVNKIKKSLKSISKSNTDLINNFIQLNCDLCNYIPENYNDLLKHFQTQHDRPPYVKCCGTIHFTRSHLVAHIKWHQNPSANKCELCNKVLKTKNCLKNHILTAHSKTEDLKYECIECGKKFPLKNRLTHHISITHGEKRFRCEICEKAFPTQHRLNAHFKAIHENISPFICDTCGRTFKSKPSFTHHVAEHQGIAIPPVQCTICGEWQKHRTALRYHISTHNQTASNCGICGRLCPTSIALRSHIHYAHKRESNLKCPLCEKTFKKRPNLKEHIALHTGEKHNKCEHCQREFRSRANMYTHIKKDHFEEWSQKRNASTKSSSYFEQQKLLTEK